MDAPTVTADAKRPRTTTSHLLWGYLVTGGAALLLVVGFVHPTAYVAPTLRASVETIMTLFAVAAAAQVRIQLLQTLRLRNLLLLGALVLLGMTEFVANAVPPALNLDSRSGFTAAYPIGQLIAAALFLAAARTPPDKVLVRARRPALIAISVAIVAFMVSEGIGLLVPAQLLAGSSSESGIQDALRHPVGLVFLLVTASLYTWASIEFSYRSGDEQSRVFLLFGQAALLLAAARLYFLALPAVSPQSVTVREVVRLLAFGFILAAALLRNLELRNAVTRAATCAERRRVAQDLHDGIAQDLAFIAAHGAQMAAEFGDEHPLMRAARHALAVSRDTITELSDTASQSPRETLEAIAHELGARFGSQIIIDVAPDAVLAAESRDQIGRITREAIANAARHGGAKHIHVLLKRHRAHWLLRVVDDGSGFASQNEGPQEGFGITSMRERAAALGGTLSLGRAGSRASVLEVRFP